MAMEFDNVGFTYHAAGAPVRALDRVSLSVHPGEMVALLGANGSGKSTLARLANALLLPHEGAVRVDGVDTTEQELAQSIRQFVAVVFQNPEDQIVATSVEDDVAFGPENLGLARDEIRVRVDDALAVVGLTGLERREPHLLSGGQKQRLAIAGALAMRPRYLVLDEPTSMLDPQGRDEVLAVMDRLRASGHGILLVTHDLAEAQRADRGAVLSAGSIVFEGPVSELLDRGETLSEWGLEPPALAVLAQRLRDLGVPVSAERVTPSAVSAALCR